MEQNLSIIVILLMIRKVNLMKLKKLFLIGLIVLLSACSSKNTPTLPEPTQDPKYIAAQSAVAFLADFLNITTEEIVIKAIEAVNWKNGCLEISRPGEACAEVITPGYKFTLAANSEDFIIHTNADGTLILMETTDPITTDEPEVVDKARIFLANELDVKASLVVTETYEARNWPDGCLGIAEPNISCIQVITPGYLITFLVDENVYKLRTDLDGTIIKIDTTKPQPGTSDS
jgi:hypothetical protein